MIGRGRALGAPNVNFNQWGSTSPAIAAGGIGKDRLEIAAQVPGRRRLLYRLCGVTFESRR
jgi:hypothetical protein